MVNSDFVRLLRKAADALEIEGVDWKPQAYRKAASSIESLRSPLESIYETGGIKALESVPGVGPAIALHIVEYLKTSKVKKWEILFKKVPVSSTELLSIQGLGPKRIQLLDKKLGITSVSELKKALKKNKLRKLPGFGAKLEQILKKSLSLYSRGHNRLLIDEASNLASEVLVYLKRNANVKHLVVAGSIRRMEETIGDIDVLAQSENPLKSMKLFAGMPSVSRVLLTGPTKTSVVLHNGVQVDLRIIAPKSYGAALLYFTGSKEHNIALRKIAIRKGYKLSEYGIYKQKRFLSRPSLKESGIYSFLGMQYIPPELRTMHGELDAAQKHSLPGLVRLQDIRGDLHMHTTYSDGAESVDAMVRSAIEHGYEYIAITDHSPSQTIANGLSIERLKEQHREIDKARKKYSGKIKILKGAEIDILKDGSLDYPDSILKTLDIRVCAVHSSLRMSREQMTERICTALNNPYLDILAHPSGRILKKRPESAINFSKVFETALENRKVLEINSQPSRLDLSSSNVFKAHDQNILFSVDTDAHASSQLDYMRFGVGIARRGWLSKRSIVNTSSFSGLKKLFRNISIS